ncbi:flavodoxin [Virgisporangium aliadipatigenens]|uniref:Flavodoxin n=1 Tax=Virgisporangium aliadipatigenens TaxID=741659 RepID=A0A8J3YPD6_9ACTN|nr:flavodoxin domain-containing protein [Virgisporangium aliadipatigenens]GIJ48122.1 flavodoxin [Virgisporangium aliadipatigenens]
MRALVVYESMFGNTRAIANAVAEGLATGMPVDVTEVGAAPATFDAELVVIGGPTHAFSMSRPATRRDAAQKADGAIVSTGIGVREWLDRQRSTLEGRQVAAFGTRMDSFMSGSAAKSLQRRLGRLGARVAVPFGDFHVEGMQGPLPEGELDRARRWGEVLAAAVTTTGTTGTRR